MKTRPNQNPQKQKKLNHSQPPRTQAAPSATNTSARQDFSSFTSSRFPALAPGLLLVLLAFLVYLPALTAGFIWDDNALTSNPAVKSLAGLWRIWTHPSLMPHEEHYWPLVYSSFWLEHLVAGMQPFLYHLDNILLHALVSLLLWRVLVLLTVPGAWLAAALFAVHPVHAQSVAWVIERKDVLSGVFYLGSALAFLSWDRGRPRPQPATVSQPANASTENWERGRPRPQPATGNQPATASLQDQASPGDRKLYFLSLALFTAALLSKSIVVTLPVALALVLWWRHGRLTRRDLLALAPLVALAVLVTLADLAFMHGQQERAGENSGLALPERILMAGRSLWLYLGKLAWPAPLAMFYPAWPVSRTALASWLPLLAWLALLAALWFFRGRIGRGAFAAAAFFCITLAPALGVIDFEFLQLSRVADRFQYLASAAPLALAAAALTQLARKFRWPAAVSRAAGMLLLALLGVLCLRQAAVYHDSIALFRANAAAYPQCWPAQTNLAWALRQAGRGAEAVESLTLALGPTPQPDYRVVHELARTLELERRFPEARHYYEEMLSLKPDFAMGRVNYGAFLAGQGDLAGAVAQYQQELSVNPGDSVCLNNLGSAYRALGRLDEAGQSFSLAIRLQPQNAGYHANLALVHLDRRQYPQAVAECRRALELDPDHFLALVTQGQALMADGHRTEAFPHFEKAVRLQSRSPVAHFLLGEAYLAQNNPREAVRCYQEALRLRPDYAEAAARLNALGASPKS